MSLGGRADSICPEGYIFARRSLARILFAAATLAANAAIAYSHRSMNRGQFHALPMSTIAVIVMHIMLHRVDWQLGSGHEVEKVTENQKSGRSLEKHGTVPIVTYFDNPMVIDKVTQQDE